MTFSLAIDRDKPLTIVKGMRHVRAKACRAVPGDVKKKKSALINTFSPSASSTVNGFPDGLKTGQRVHSERHGPRAKPFEEGWLPIRVYDHSRKVFIRGLRLLPLGWNGGNTFIPEGGSKPIRRSGSTTIPSSLPS